MRLLALALAAAAVMPALPVTAAERTPPPPVVVVTDNSGCDPYYRATIELDVVSICVYQSND